MPDSHNVLVTALGTRSDSVPKMESVTERLLHEELKMKDKKNEDDTSRKALTARQKSRMNPKKQLTSHYFNKPGHFK